MPFHELVFMCIYNLKGNAGSWNIGEKKKKKVHTWQRFKLLHHGRDKNCERWKHQICILQIHETNINAIFPSCFPCCFCLKFEWCSTFLFCTDLYHLTHIFFWWLNGNGLGINVTIDSHLSSNSLIGHIKSGFLIVILKMQQDSVHSCWHFNFQ